MTHRFAIWTLSISLQLGTIGALPCPAQDTAAQNSAQAPVPRVSISSSIAGGMLVSKVNPVYPPLARQARIQGIVILKVNVSKTGDIEDVQLVSGHPMLAPAAIEAVKQWKYRPYLLNGDPIEVDTKIQVNFVLAGEKPAEGTVGDQPTTASPGQPTDQASNIASPAPTTMPRNAVPQRIRVSSGVAQKLLIRKVNPTYPHDAREQGIQGVVALQIVIDKVGNVSDATLISGNPLLAAAAIEAVKQWKYKPFLFYNTPLEVDTQALVNFKLSK
jgi:TonB family protein